MAYTIAFAPRAVRQFKNLPKKLQVKLRTKIDVLAENPRPAGAEKLAGASDLYRIRTGDYRIIYQVQDQILLVLVASVGHRRDIYRRMP